MMYGKMACKMQSICTEIKCNEYLSGTENLAKIFVILIFCHP